MSVVVNGLQVTGLVAGRGVPRSVKGMRSFILLVMVFAGCESVACWDVDGNVTAGVCECPSGDASADALAAVNTARGASGLSPVVRLAELDAAAQGHIAYLRANNPDDAGVSSHGQSAGNAGFTGETHFERAVAADWSGARLYEDISRAGVPEQAVFGWLRTVYHRVPILTPEVDGMGYAQTCSDGVRFDVALFAESGSATSADVMVWPADGDTFVPGRWDGLERPDPVPDIQADLGYPVSVQFRREVGGNVQGFRLFNAEGEEVPTRFIDAASDPSDSLDDEVFAVPLAPLEPERTYRVQVTGSLRGAPFTREWVFGTRTDSQTPQ